MHRVINGFQTLVANAFVVGIERGAHIVNGEVFNRLVQFGRGVVRREGNLLFADFVANALDEFHDFLVGFVTEHNAVKHHIVGHFVCARFNHGDQGVGRSHGHGHLRFLTLFGGGIDDIFAVHQADGNAAYRAVPRDFGNADGNRNTDHGGDFGRAVGVNGHHRCHHADIVAHVLGEQRANGAVNHARGKRSLFARSAFTALERTGDSAHGIEFFLKIHGKREEIHALTRFGGHCGGAKHFGLAVADKTGAARKLRHFADFHF